MGPTQTLATYLLDKALARNRHRDKLYKSLPKDIVDTVLNAYDKNQDLSELERLTGYSYHTIRRVLKDYIDKETVDA